MYASPVPRRLGLAGLFAVLAAPAAFSQAAPLFTVHGYLTQAYGASSGDVVLGLTDRGTADYRRAAILARLTPTTDDALVVQIAHRRLGASPTMQFEKELKLDMAFYQHQFGTGASVRAGRTLIPFGIFNEVRYAGTLVPFYRPPFSVYSEGTHTSETIDGVQISQRLRAGEPWEVSVDLYGGTFKYLEFGTVFNPTANRPEYRGGRMQSKDAVGGQVWLQMPIEGVRVGTSAKRHWDEGGVYPRPGGELTTDVTASLEASFDRVQFRSEQLYVHTNGFSMNSRYVQGGARLLPHVSLNAQMDFSDQRVTDAPFTGQRIPTVRDNALGVNVSLSTNSVVKLEFHRTNGYNVEQVADMLGPTLKGSYFISSFSISF
jgi:hypothetical protein